MIFRLVLLAYQTHQLPAENTVGLTLQALFMGWRFDTVISSYLLILPVLIILILPLFKRISGGLLKTIYNCITLLFVCAFMLCSADIPFFNHFFVRLNNTIFLWMDNPDFAAGFVFGEKSFYFFFILFFVVSGLYIWFMQRIRKAHQNYLPIKSTKQKEKKNISSWGRLLYLYILLILCSLGLIFLAGRGRISFKAPISVGTAFFTNNIFLNQLGLNPVFTLMRSVMDAGKPENQRLHWLDDEEALHIVTELFHADSSLGTPVARRAKVDTLLKGKNIILVLMESMATNKMSYFGNTENLTPFFDSLSTQSWFYDNCYSAGIHTFNGVYSTLFAHPALMKRHTMKSVKPVIMAGFSNILSENDYHTVFFTTHDEQFDNMSGFLSSNGFQTIVGQKDYPASEVRSNLGIPDYFMFRHAIPCFNKYYESGKPFFATLLTASDHAPYVVPDDVGFVPRSNDIRKQVTEFADWSIAQFFQMAGQEPWYNNTVFIFIADHGMINGELRYDVMLNYHHVPLVIYYSGIEPKVDFHLALQEDVFPTIMSRLGIPYVNNTFGIDLQNEQRDYIIFSSDDKLACMNDSLLYIYRENIKDGIYRYRDNNLNEESDKFPKELETMKKLGFSLLQSSQWMLEKNRTGLIKEK
jgi:phosphoglycerol transferase MdoB-like AlkP superfamily enzyme